MKSSEIDKQLVGTVDFLKKKLYEAENQAGSFRTIFDALPGCVYLKDREGKHLLLNKYSRDHLKNLYGISEDTVGKTDLEVFPRKWAEKFQENDKEVLSYGKTISIEEEIELPSGKKLTQLSIKKPLHDENGKIIGLIGTTIDITEKKQAQLEIEKAKQKAEELNQAKSEFIANMNHDLRTPLSGILGIADLALQRLSKFDPNRKDFKAIHNSANQLINLTNKIVESSSLEFKQDISAAKIFSIQTIIQHFHDLIRPALSHKGLSYIVQGADDCPSLLQGPAEIIYRILINLVGNAIKFTDQGTITLNLSVHELEKSERSQLVITINDTGIGIPKDKQEVIFEPFRRLTSSYQGRYPGTGLGLYAVKSMVDLVDGQIFLISEINQGSTFTCVIPVKIADSSDSISHKESFVFETDCSNEMMAAFETRPDFKSESLSGGQSLEQQKEFSPHVLVVEDNQVAQHIASQYLIQQNCQVDTAESVAEAIRLANENDYQLILMDVGLPDGDGKDATKNIRSAQQSKNQNTPIIALTAHVDKSTKQDCLVAGMDKIYNKPLTPKKLNEILNAFLVTDDPQSNTKEINSRSAEPAPAVIDLNAAMELMQCDEENAKAMLDMFVASLGEECKQLEAAFYNRTASRWEQVRKITHRLRGACSYCGVPQLHRCCETLEMLLLDKTGLKNRAEIIQSYHDLINAIKTVQLVYQKG